MYINIYIFLISIKFTAFYSVLLIANHPMISGIHSAYAAGPFVT